MLEANGFNAIQHVQEQIKGNVESMLNESLNQFKFDSKRFQQAFNIFTLSTLLKIRPAQTPPTFGSTKC